MIFLDRLNLLIVKHSILGGALKSMVYLVINNVVKTLLITIKI